MLLYAFAIFLSAFLLFLVQPLIARIILPWFGGSASVWTTCLMFFQTTLLGGYFYSHVVAVRLKPKAQAWLHIGLLAASLLVLPILPGASFKPIDGLHPELRIVVLLAATVGIPYLLLSTTGPLLQSWFARAYPTASTYRLYSLSNVGSLLALISYPVIIEPLLPARMQAYIWSVAYAAFAALCAVAAYVAMRHATSEQAPPAEAPVHIDWREKALWAGLAFCPSSLLVGITSHMTQNISPIPLLWVAPLALYLLSFILTFDSERWYKRGIWFPLFITAAGLMVAFLFPDKRNLEIRLLVPIFLGSFFTVAMTCHGELYRRRPPNAGLTSFYLMVALGGALGGIFVGFISPMVFNYYYEVPITMLIAVLLVTVAMRDGEAALPGPHAKIIQRVVLWCAAFGFVYLLAWEIPRWARDYKVLVRNFYGVLRVEETPETKDEAGLLELHNGSINHGAEFTDPKRHLEPTTYYGPRSGVGMAMKAAQRDGPARAGVIGLGAGTLAAYGRARDQYRFYDINPLVVDIAQNQFFYLRESPQAKSIALGDARLSLERESPQNFDVLAVDAFSSDSIPIHLLTIEAFRLYFNHLKPDGILAVHISNRYLRLQDVVWRAAQTLGVRAILIEGESDSDKDIDHTDWALMTRDPGLFDRPEWKVGKALDPATIPTWTDDHSSVLRILK